MTAQLMTHQIATVSCRPGERSTTMSDFGSPTSLSAFKARYPMYVRRPKVGTFRRNGERKVGLGKLGVRLGWLGVWQHNTTIEHCDFSFFLGRGLGVKYCTLHGISTKIESLIVAMSFDFGSLVDGVMPPLCVDLFRVICCF